MTDSNRPWETEWIELLTQLYRVLMNPLPGEQITRSQRMVLLSLAAEDRLSMGQIAACLTSSREQASRAVSALESAGLVTRSPDPDNRTRVLVALSDAGAAAIGQYWAQLQPVFRQRLDALPPEARDELGSSLLCVCGFLRGL